MCAWPKINLDLENFHVLQSCHYGGTNFSLSAAALGPGSLFGLATFSHRIGLYDVQGPVPVVKNVFIPPDSEDRLSLELEDVMPLLQFLAPVCHLCN